MFVCCSKSVHSKEPQVVRINLKGSTAATIIALVRPWDINISASTVPFASAQNDWGCWKELAVTCADKVVCEKFLVD